MQDNLRSIKRLISTEEIVKLANCGIIKLKRVKQETKPIALYDEIVIKSFPNLEVKPMFTHNYTVFDFGFREP